MSIRATVNACVLSTAALFAGAAQAQAPFQLEEASIADMHAAIKSGATTCEGVVQGYIARARAYNGTCSALVTPDGKSVAAAKGQVRGGAALTFPTKTIAISELVPDFASY